MAQDEQGGTALAEGCPTDLESRMTATLDLVDVDESTMDSDVIHGKCLSCWPDKGPAIAICGEPYISEIDYDRPPPPNACKICLTAPRCSRCGRHFIN